MVSTLMTDFGPRPREAAGWDDDRRWQAVIQRDRRYDGTFWYGVRTTGVYCRPGCGARMPRRENVRFFVSRADAERDGFRPCKRCRPAEAKLGARQAAVVAGACRAIQAADEPPTLAELALAAGMSRFHFHRLFRAITGLTPRAYAAGYRAARVRERLLGAGTVTSAIYDAGFNSSGRFYAGSQGVLGMTPRVFRDGAPGITLRFAVGQCRLGALLVAATEKGVCAIMLGDDPDRLIGDLEDQFPRAQLIGADAGFEQLVARVVGFVESPGTGLDLPLDVRGTAFQQQVWQALREIPAGSTASYAEIARRVGQPSGARAVARACASNPLAVAIPCHRVVRSDGALSGYRWGIERKRALLEREASS